MLNRRTARKLAMANSPEGLLIAYVGTTCQRHSRRGNARYYPGISEGSFRHDNGIVGSYCIVLTQSFRNKECD
jgi:hypothetical protein